MICFVLKTCFDAKQQTILQITNNHAERDFGQSQWPSDLRRRSAIESFLIHEGSGKNSMVGYADSVGETRLWNASVLTVVNEVWVDSICAEVPRKRLSDEERKIISALVWTVKKRIMLEMTSATSRKDNAAASKSTEQ